MEKRRLASITTATTTTPGDLSTATNPAVSPSTDHPSTAINNSNSAFWQPTRPTDRGATLGKLHEVDLGEENKLKNIHRTAEATRRLEDTTPATTTDDPQSSSKSRKRRRRNSQDIQRDKLVEEVLKESKRMLLAPDIFAFLPFSFSVPC